MKLWPLLTLLFRRLHIRNKIIVVYIPLIIIPLLVVGIFSNHMFTNSLIKRTEQNVLDESNLILTRIDSMIRNSESGANIMMEDFNHIYATFPKPKNPYEENLLRIQIQTQFSIDLMNFSDVDSAAFIDSEERVYTSYFPMRERDTEEAWAPFIKRLNNLPGYGTNNWFPMELRDYLVTDPLDPVISIGKQIIDLEDGGTIGVLVVNIKESSIADVYDNMTSSTNGYYLIMDRQGTIVSSPDKSQLLQPMEDESLRSLILSNESLSEIVHSESGANLITSVAYDKMGWKLVHIVPQKMITSDIRKNNRMTIIVGLICLLFALLGAGILSRLIVGPLQKLAKAMRLVKEVEMDESAKIRTSDEIGVLSAVFNSMIVRMKELLEQVENEQRQKKEYELALIHAQIKPHFLYNTLDLIYMLNDMDRSREARDTTKSLADFYRVALSAGREMITVTEEIKNARDYLIIQHARYPDVFDFHIDLPKDIQRAVIPKLSVQPLVENAIYHGLKLKGSKGNIWIGGYREGNTAIILVKDDGIGLSQSRLDEIWNGGARTDKPASFGMFSVHQRIRLYFGNDYGISIDSKENQGTEIKIRIPLDGNRGNWID